MSASVLSAEIEPQRAAAATPHVSHAPRRPALGVIDSVHVLLTDGSAGRVSFDDAHGISVSKEGLFVDTVSLPALMALASYADYPPAHVVQKIATLLAPGELTAQHQASLIVSVRDWLNHIRTRQPAPRAF